MINFHALSSCFFMFFFISADHTSVVTKELPKKKGIKKTTDKRHLYDVSRFH